MVFTLPTHFLFDLSLVVWANLCIRAIRAILVLALAVGPGAALSSAASLSRLQSKLNAPSFRNLFLVQLAEHVFLVFKAFDL